jgi:hypothetical protein
MATIPVVELETQISSIPDVLPARKFGTEIKRQSPLRRMRELLNIWIPCRHLSGNPHCQKCEPAYREYLTLAKAHMAKAARR